MITDYGVFQILKKGEHIIQSHIGQTVSFFTSKKTEKVSTFMLKYSFIKNNISDCFSYTLNESISNSFKGNTKRKSTSFYWSQINETNLSE